MTKLLSVLAVLAVACSPTADAAPGASANTAWEGAVSAGKTVWIRNMNGPIKAVATSGSKVVVRATVTTQTGKTPVNVDIVAVPHDGTVTVCALWPGKKPGTCKPRGSVTNNGTKDNHTSVAFEVLVPKGVRVDLQTVNGPVHADSLAADVVATTVNGSVRVETSRGAVTATTVNGSVAAVVGKAGANISLTTVNGSIDADVADNYSAKVSATVVNGRIRADLPVSGARKDKRSLSGTLGGGAKAISMTTVNGSIVLR